MRNRLRAFRPRLWMVSWVLLAVLAMLILLPLANMFLQMNGKNIADVLGRKDLTQALGNSMVASLLTTVISLIVAYCLAWTMERTCIPGKKLLRVLIVMPMLIPSVSIGMGVVLLGGNNGLLTNLLGIQGGGIYGLSGIVWGSVMYSLPPAFVMMENVLRYEDSAPYEAAAVLGIPRWRQFTGITLPYLKKPLITMAFSVFTLSFTDYGVPLMVGGKFKTLPMVMYQKVIGQLKFGEGCVYGAILLIPAVISFVLDMANRNSGGSANRRLFAITPDRRRDIPALIGTAVCALAGILPILSFVILAFVGGYHSGASFSFRNFSSAFSMGGGNYLLNSVLIAAMASAAGVCLCVLTAYFTARTPMKAGRYLHLIAMSTGAVPGVVLGLAYVLLFRNSFLYGTVLILVMVNIVHFFASPYLMIYTSFSKLSENLESVAATLKISRLRLLTGVILPQCADTIKEMVSYFFVNCMMTISAVSFLANTGNKPIALMINQFEAQSQMGAAAVVSLLILVVNLIVKTWMTPRTAGAGAAEHHEK